MNPIQLAQMAAQRAAEQAKQRMENPASVLDTVRLGGDASRLSDAKKAEIAARVDREDTARRDHAQAIYRTPKDPRESMKFVAKDGDIFERDEESKQLSTTPMSVTDIMNKSGELSGQFQSAIDKGKALKQEIRTDIESSAAKSGINAERRKEIENEMRRKSEENRARLAAEREARRQSPEYKARIEQESARRMEAAYPTNSLSTNSLLSRATGRPAYEFARSDERTASVLAQSERAGQRVQQSRERNADFIRGNREYLQGLGQPARRPLFREFVEYYKNVLIF